MFSVGIFGNNLFIFSAFILTFFQSSFLGDGNKVFFIITIFFISFTFILSSCVNFCFVMLMGEIFGYSLYCVSVLLWFSWFSVFCISVRVVGSCLSLLFLLVGTFLVSQGQKTVLPLILFKIAQQYNSEIHFVVFNLSSQFFPLVCLSWIVTLVVVYVPEFRTANFHRMLIGSHMLAIEVALVDRDTQTCCLGHTLNFVSICHFFMGSILWLY